MPSHNQKSQGKQHRSPDLDPKHGLLCQQQRVVSAQMISRGGMSLVLMKKLWLFKAELNQLTISFSRILATAGNTEIRQKSPLSPPLAML